MEFQSAMEESRGTYPSWWKDIWNCDHGNPNVQEEREGYVHRETHCRRDVETMENRSKTRYVVQLN